MHEGLINKHGLFRFGLFFLEGFLWFGSVVMFTLLVWRGSTVPYSHIYAVINNIIGVLFPPASVKKPKSIREESLNTLVHYKTSQYGFFYYSFSDVCTVIYHLSTKLLECERERERELMTLKHVFCMPWL